MWRSGPGVDQAPSQRHCGRFYWVLGQWLLKETAGDQERKDTAQREFLTAYAWQERATRGEQGQGTGSGSSELKGAWAGQVSPSRASVFSPEKWVTAT